MSMKLLYLRYEIPLSMKSILSVISCNRYIPFLRKNIIMNKTVILQEALRNYSIVFDAVYIPKETRLLREAAECGRTVVNGLEMLARLAVVQFELFTGGMPGTFF